MEGSCEFFFGLNFLIYLILLVIDLFEICRVNFWLRSFRLWVVILLYVVFSLYKI